MPRRDGVLQARAACRSRSLPGRRARVRPSPSSTSAGSDPGWLIRSTAMSSSGADRSTRAVMVVPSGRRIVTLVLAPTTCTLVRIVSGATKNPLPKPVAVSTRTTRRHRAADDVLESGRSRRRAAASRRPSASRALGCRGGRHDALERGRLRPCGATSAAGRDRGRRRCGAGLGRSGGRRCRGARRSGRTAAAARVERDRQMPMTCPRCDADWRGRAAGLRRRRGRAAAVGECHALDALAAAARQRRRRDPASAGRADPAQRRRGTAIYGKILTYSWSSGTQHG